MSGLKVSGKCKSCGRITTTTAPVGRSTWRGDCQCGARVIARRVKDEPTTEPAPAAGPTTTGREPRPIPKASGYDQSKRPNSGGKSTARVQGPAAPGPAAGGPGDGQPGQPGGAGPDRPEPPAQPPAAQPPAARQPGVRRGHTHPYAELFGG